MNRDEYTQVNRHMWNKTADVHAREHFKKLLRRVRQPDFSTFDDVELSVFRTIDVAEKSVVQLGCNNGCEIIGVKRAGAGRCLGVDISDRFIEQARELNAAAKVDVEFLQCDIYQLPNDLDGQFDVVYITIGVFGWLPHLDAAFDVICRLLKPDGWLFVYDMHPILNMFKPNEALQIQASYFQHEPDYVESEADYIDPSQFVDAPSYWFAHTLSDVIGECLRHQLDLVHFQEYAHDLSLAFAEFERLRHRLPLSYSMLARRTM